MRCTLIAYALAPGQLLTMTDEDRSCEEAIIRRLRCGPIAQETISTFSLHGGRPDRRRTSLQKLDPKIDAAVNSICAGLAYLLDDGDVSTTIDVGSTAEHDVFDIVAGADPDEQHGHLRLPQALTASTKRRTMNSLRSSA